MAQKRNDDLVQLLTPDFMRRCLILSKLAALNDPGADRIMLWDDSESEFVWTVNGAGT